MRSVAVWIGVIALACVCPVAVTAQPFGATVAPSGIGKAATPPRSLKRRVPRKTNLRYVKCRCHGGDVCAVPQSRTLCVTGGEGEMMGV